MAIEPVVHQAKLPAVHRRRRRRRLAHRQGAAERQLGVHLRQLRHERDRHARDRPERPERQHDLRRHRRAERVGRLRGRDGHLQVDGRRRHLDAAAGQRDRAVELPRTRGRDIAIAPNGDIIVGIARAIRGYSGNTGGATSQPAAVDPAGELRRLRSTNGGATFTPDLGRATQLGPRRHARRARPEHPDDDLRRRRSSWASGARSRGATWTQIKTPLSPALNTDRAEFAVNDAAGRQDADVRRHREPARGRRRRASGAPTTPPARPSSPT